MYTNYLVTFWCLLCDSVGFYKMNIDAISHTLYLVLCCTIWLSKCRQIKEISVKFYSVKQASIQVYIFALYPMSQRCLCHRYVQTVQRNWLQSNTALVNKASTAALICWLLVTSWLYMIFHMRLFISIVCSCQKKNLCTKTLKTTCYSPYLLLLVRKYTQEQAKVQVQTAETLMVRTVLYA